MGVRTGEQARRKLVGLESLAALEPEAVKQRRLDNAAIYRQAMERRDKSRTVQFLRSEANRIEAEALGLWVDETTFENAEGVGVTDHALVRFLERVVGLDMEAIRDEIGRLVMPSDLPSKQRNGVKTVGGFHLLLSPKAVISVLSPGMQFEPWLEKTSNG